MTEVGRDHGLIVHAAARTGAGLLVVNLWPSEDGSRAAAGDARRIGVLQQHGLDPDQIHREHHVVTNYVVFEGPSPSPGQAASPAIAARARGGAPPA